MADSSYRNLNFVFVSKGIAARNVDDTLGEGWFLNEGNCEELAENSIANRLGSSIVNKTVSVVEALPGLIHSVAKLAFTDSTGSRYAGVDGTLWRRKSLTQGPYTEIVPSEMSGGPWQSANDLPSNIAAIPFIFIADANMMLKDDGTFTSPQQMGIFQPQYPVAAAVQKPDVIVLDNYTGLSTAYTYTGISGGTIEQYVNTILGNEPGPGLSYGVAEDPTQIGLFQLLTIGSGPDEETVLTLAQNYQSGNPAFEADFLYSHVIFEAIAANALSVTVPANTTATVSLAFGGKPIAAWPTTLQQEDYIGLYVYVGDPTQIQSITLKFDCGDGSFNTDYFYKTIAQGPLQNLLNATNSPTTAATDAILSDALDIYGNSPGGVGALQSGLDTWTPFLFQLSDFAGAGRADFDDTVFNWSNVNGYQVTIVTNDGASVTVQLASLILMGGFGPDTLGGVAYDYLFTYYNINDGTESNPCMPMTNVNPPNDTYWVYPRREPVMLTMYHPTLDPQTTHLRIYRRGGTLGDNYRREDQIPCSGARTTYLDQASDEDIQEADFVSFTNDVPVTSSLPVPVNTTLLDNTPEPAPGTPVSIYPVSMDNISLDQQVDIGNPVDPANTFETVVVVAVFSDHFQACLQNLHLAGENVQATAKYGQPVTIIAQAFGQMWFAGDPNNLNYLYWSANSYPQAVSSAAYVPVSTPDDPITAIVQFKGNLYVSTVKGWWAVAPGSNANQSPTIYPTACKHGCVAPLGFCVTEEAIFYQAVDGIRAFAGGASTYLTQDQEFLFQGVGSSPIVEANMSKLNQTRMAYWNAMIFVSYIGVDGDRHRVILHTQYKRWRNDDLDVQSMILEADTNTLVFGDSEGLVRIDRQDQAYDEANNAGVLFKDSIAINLQSPYSDQSEPAIQKQYNEFTIDCNTNGQTLTITLLFNDGEESLVLGTVNTTERSRVNFNIEDGDGYQAYKVSVQITGEVSAFVYIYQAGVKYLSLAKTRQSLDTFQLRLGTDESKIAKNVFWEYTCTAPITFEVYYDDNSTAGFTFTMPNTNGVRNALRVRLPAASFRMIRFVGTSDEDFMVWESSRIEFKVQGQGKGYQIIEFVPNG